MRAELCQIMVGEARVGWAVVRPNSTYLSTLIFSEQPRAEAALKLWWSDALTEAERTALWRQVYPG